MSQQFYLLFYKTEFIIIFAHY